MLKLTLQMLQGEWLTLKKQRRLQEVAQNVPASPVDEGEACGLAISSRLVILAGADVADKPSPGCGVTFECVTRGPWSTRGDAWGFRST